MEKLRAGIYIDRDNCINECPAGIPGDPAGYITKWEDFEFHEDVELAFALMYTMEYHVFVVSNQSGVSRENIDCNQYSIESIFNQMSNALNFSVSERIREDLENQQVSGERPAIPFPGPLNPVVKDYMFCPHLDEHNCACRKPKPGMIWALAVSYGIDLSRSWIIGDSERDIRSGYGAGIRRMIRIDHDAPYFMWPEGQTPKLPKKLSDVVRVPSLLNAVEIIKTYDAYIEKVWGPKNGDV